MNQIYSDDKPTRLKRIGVDDTALLGNILTEDYWSIDIKSPERYVRIFRFLVPGKVQREQNSRQTTGLRDPSYEYVLLGMKLEYLVNKFGSALSEEDTVILNSYERLKENVDVHKHANELDKINDARAWFDSGEN
ncbi:MAG: hypothetical protein ACTIKR_17580 [Advenella sp.]|uniref:hypothetical protein n=1 Tax=Advenella sp. TaxID=1872388 RepID=UPI003F992A21